MRILTIIQRLNSPKFASLKILYMQQQKSNPNLIVLIGYMGCGKSTVGSALATAVGYRFIDLDHFLELKHQATVPDLFKTKGVKAFRDLEHQALVEVLQTNTPTVLSLGGGTPCYHDNISLLQQATNKVFYLESSPAVLAARLFPNKSSRPLIAHIQTEQELQQFIAKHLFERQPYYRQANHQVDVATRDVDQLVNQIRSLL